MSKKPSKKRPAKPPRPQLVKQNGERTMAKTDVDRFLEEEEERATKKAEMIQALLVERDEAMAEYDRKLGLLGYRASTVSTPRPAKEGSKRQRDPNKVCDVCQFVTSPPHDARKHRSQGKDKKPFTNDELVQLGLQKAS
jgi:hypothetical protein